MSSERRAGISTRGASSGAAEDDGAAPSATGEGAHRNEDGNDPPDPHATRARQPADADRSVAHAGVAAARRANLDPALQRADQAARH